MDILIIGNGFDLSHYLPTKYDHFMDVMDAIETHQGDSMAFDELYSKCRENWFIAKTKNYYKTKNVIIEKAKLIEIKSLLKENSWYKYFKRHVKEVKTWIDFEQKIECVLQVTSRCIKDILTIDNSEEAFKYFNLNEKDKLKIKINDLKIIKLFNFVEVEKVQKIIQPAILRNGITQEQKIREIERESLNPKFCYGENIRNGLNSAEFLDFLNQGLEKFIGIFNLYLELVIDNLEPISKFKIAANRWSHPDHIFSFNYTNTFRKFYQSETKAEFLHGRFGEEQNIVLGISDLEDDSLKTLKAYGFTKYHQKIFKETDYLFLDLYKKKVLLHKRTIEYFEKDFGFEDPTKRKFRRQEIMEVESKLNLNIKIWGHSLDVSDKDYIADLFSLNDDIDRNVRVTVYYFDRAAKFALLNNLLSILEKDKVEHWMKNKWLIFEPNPEIRFTDDVLLAGN